MSLNKAMIIGNAGKDPEVRYIDSRSGKVKAATFTVATDERFRDSSGAWKEHTEWHSVIVWNRLADFVEKYVKKGTLLYVEGRLRTYSWTGSDGIQKTVTRIAAESIQVLGRQEGMPPSSAGYGHTDGDACRKTEETEAKDGHEQEEDDGLPF